MAINRSQINPKNFVNKILNERKRISIYSHKQIIVLMILQANGVFELGSFTVKLWDSLYSWKIFLNSNVLLLKRELIKHSQIPRKYHKTYNSQYNIICDGSTRGMA